MFPCRCQHPPSRLDDPQARDLDLLSARMYAVSAHGRVPGENYLGKHVNVEAVCPHHGLGAAVRRRGEQFERAAAVGLTPSRSGFSSGLNS
jgi:hypothetical protein